MDATSHSTLLTAIYLLGPRSPRGWLNKAVDELTETRYDITETPALSVALEILREQPFDVVLIDADAQHRALPEVISTIQSQTHVHQPILIMADGEERMAAGGCLQAGASAYISIKSTTARELAWQLETAARHGREAAELQRLRSWKENYIERQQSELTRLLDEQVEIFTTATNLRQHQQSDGEAQVDSCELAVQCSELLKAYVVMGRGQLATEVQRFAQWLCDQHINLATLLQFFSRATHALVQDRATRSARLVYDRSNLLLLDLILQWADAKACRDNHGPLDHHSDLQRDRQHRPAAS